MFSNVIKVTRKKDAIIQSYAMRDMDRHPEVRKEKEPSFTLSSGSTADPGMKVDQLMEEIGEREKYIKQMTDKNHSLEKEAYEKGFAQGEKAGRELGERRFDSVIKSFTEAADDLSSLREKMYQENEQQLLELVLAVARKVIQKEVETDKQILLDVLRSALHYVADREVVKVRINPSDLEFASQHKAELIREIEGLGKLTFEGDVDVSRGDALIESSYGIVDAGVEKHLKAVEEILRNKAQEKGPEVSEHEGDKPDNDG